MSIIEKALDKLEDKDESAKKPGREPRRVARVPATDLDPGRPAAQKRVADTLTLDDAPDEAPILPPAAAVSRPARDRTQQPQFPRRTLKQVDIAFARLDAAGIITPDTQRTMLVEQFRAIKRPLLMKAAKASDGKVPNGNLILVTSSVPGEGKTFTSINLAMSIAMELDHTVLLVDADVVRGEVSHILGIQEPEGLVDYLAQPERALSEFLVRTSIEKLTVLPAGRMRANVTELFASEEMRALAVELARRYADRIIIVDSPPLLAASGASVLTQLAGQTVFVVEAVRTPQSAVREALGMIRAIRNVGLVLNKSRLDAGVGYQYGHYYPHGSDQR